MKKNRWGFLNICVAAVIAAGGVMAVADSVNADTDTGSGTATVTFTGGSQIVQVPNFDFGRNNAPSGAGLFDLINTADSGATSGSLTSAGVRALTVRVPSQKGATAAEDGWYVSVAYQSDNSANSAKLAASNASIIFNLTNETADKPQTGGMTIMYGDDSGTFQDIGWSGSNTDGNWVVNYLPPNDKTYMEGTNTAANLPSASDIQYSGFVPAGWTPKSDSIGDYSGVVVFGRKTSVNDVDLSKPATNYTNPYYRLNFPFKDSAQIFVPWKSQIANLNNVLTGNLVWTLSKGAPAYTWTKPQS